MGKPHYICITCGQDFTRKPSASRHSVNLHFGQCRIVEVLDYLIGRVSGEYPPPDRTLRRRPNTKTNDQFGRNVHDIIGHIHKQEGTRGVRLRLRNNNSAIKPQSMEILIPHNPRKTKNSNKNGLEHLMSLKQGCQN